MDRLLELLRGRVRRDSPFDQRTPLLSSGLVDSFHLAELIAAIEAEYGVRIPESEIGVDNFDTPEQMLELVERLRQAG